MHGWNIFTERAAKEAASTVGGAKSGCLKFKSSLSWRGPEALLLMHPQGLVM